MVPEVPGGNPVMELAPSGYMPISPVRTVGPVLVMAEAASTAKGAAVLRLTFSRKKTAGGYKLFM